MACYRIRPAVVEDVDHLSRIAREADIRELWASSRHMPREAMLQGLRVSDMAAVVEINGAPVCMFGVVPLSADTGISWKR